MPKVSIIVPVYKVEPYIRECLNSIMQQTYTDWECLLIDDGSPDSSGKICDEYAQKDARFKVFHVQNGGVSQARNIGLDNMSGEWVMFVDSDDAIAPETLEICLNKIVRNNIDIIQYSFAKNKEDLGKTKEEAYEIMKLEDYIKARKYLVCVGGSIMRSAIIKKNNLRFDPILKLAEDQLFVYQYINCCSSLMRINDCFYWYRFNGNSASRNQKTYDIKNSIAALVSYRNKIDIWRPVIDKVLTYFVVDIINNDDMNTHMLINLIKQCDIKDCTMLTGTYKVFFLLSRINVRFAIGFIRKRYNKQ